MAEVTITLPDNSTKKMSKGATIKDIAESIGAGLARAAIAGKIDGELVDVSAKVEKDAKIEIITASSEEGLDILRHSTAHVLADAVVSLFPGAKPTIGPSIENGFYYDFDLPRPLIPEDLETLEASMRDIVGEDHAFAKEIVDRGKAAALFADQPYKLEILNDLS
ncbi:MAG: TGS domain-containing protein, partial [Candidatus Aenigmarchaeota archaeon]|nr:TGS domain-containing protein [Candidatus Aenigmarchaeota archaeon]